MRALGYLPYAVCVWLALVALYGIVSSRNLVHLVGCVSVFQSATYVLLLAVGYRRGGIAPVFVSAPPSAPTVDPVVQALMLTDVVVEATVMALLLSLALKAHERCRTFDPTLLRRLRG